MVTVIWIVAYLIGGFRWVWFDQRRRGADRKAYVKSARHRWTTRILWLPLSVLFVADGMRRRDIQSVRETFFENVAPSLIIFVAIGLLTTYLATRSVPIY